MSDRGRRRTALALMLLVGFGATSCATASPGDAAVVGSTRIAQATIGAELRSVNELVGLPPDSPSDQGAQALVYGNVVVELVAQTAARYGVSVPDAQIDQYYDQQVQAAGGEDALKQALAQQGIAPELIRGFVRSTLLQQALANRIAPDGDPQAQSDALRTAVTEVADEVGVMVAPKYGEWDSATLQIVDPTDPVAKAPEAAGVGVPSPAPSPSPTS